MPTRGYTLRVSGYTFGKRYAVEASSEFENVQVTIAFEAEFVALPEKIEVTLPAATLAYDATEELFVAEDTSVVGELFEQVKDHFTDAAELATSLTRPTMEARPTVRTHSIRLSAATGRWRRTTGSSTVRILRRSPASPWPTTAR